MPSKKSLGLNEMEGVAPRRVEPCEENQEETVAVVDAGLLVLRRSTISCCRRRILARDTTTLS